jgi:hypothetical protein
MLSTAGRGGAPTVSPRPSEDLGALEGWTLSKNEAAVEAARKAVEARASAAQEGEGAAKAE